MDTGKLIHGLQHLEFRAGEILEEIKTIRYSKYDFIQNGYFEEYLNYYKNMLPYIESLACLHPESDMPNQLKIYRKNLQALNNCSKMEAGPVPFIPKSWLAILPFFNPFPQIIEAFTCLRKDLINLIYQIKINS